MSLYNFKKVKGRKQIVWNKGRFRGLEEAKERIGDIEKEVGILLKNKKKINVLEIGCGYGKILLELKKIYGERVNIYGTNLEPRWNKKIVEKFALSHKIFSKKELSRNLPKIYILDIGKKIPLKSDYYDLIFSQATFQYIENKALALENVNRLLTNKGKAIIELQEFKSKLPIEYQNLFEIWNKDEKIESIDYLKRFRNIKIKRYKREWHVLEMKNIKNFKLNLKLITSFDLNKINNDWWGSKCIYILKRG